MQPNYDVVGLGSAIVDVLAHVEDVFLSKHDMRKGSMQLIDEQTASTLYSELHAPIECSGGSVANTLAGMASLGASTAFIGKVASDALGNVFTKDMQKTGVHFTTKAANEPATASCIICVTPDGERTMSTFLGACTQLRSGDMDESLIAAAQLLYIEGYQWDMPEAKLAIGKAISMAKKHGRKVALTLSDTFCVHRFRPEFIDLIRNEVDILFANEAELTALTEENDFDNAVSKAQSFIREVAAITRSDKGAVIITPRTKEVVSGEKVARVVDTTGAGDLFAAGFLYGYTHGWEHAKSAALGNRCAAEIIQQLGARSSKSLDRLVA